MYIYHSVTIKSCSLELMGVQSSTVHEYTCPCILGNSKNVGAKKKLIESLQNISYEWTNLVAWVVKR